MTKFFALIHKEPGSAYGISFPDVEGCFSAADTEDDILPNALEALALHIGADTPPEARSIDEVARDPAVAAELASGAYLAAVPLVSTYHKPVRVNLSLGRGILAAIDEAAKARGLTRSAFLAEAARNEIEKRSA